MPRTRPAAALLLLCALAACQPDAAPAPDAAEAPGAGASPSVAAQVASAAGAAGPPLGRYVCNHVWWNVGQGRSVFDYKGYFELLPGNTYRWLDDGGTGRYAVDAATGAPVWVNGPLSEKQPSATTYGMDGDTPEIVLAFEEPVEWQCVRETAEG